MVTYRQVSRGMVRTMRAMDREAQRAQRQRIAYEKAAQRQAFLEASADAAGEYENMLEAITGAHRIGLLRCDWQTVAAKQPMTEPGRREVHEVASREVLSRYKPGWFATTFGMAERTRATLSSAIRVGQAKDEAIYQAELAAARTHNDEIAFARGVMAGDHAAIAEALTRCSALGDLPFVVEDVDLMFTSDGRLIAMVDGLDLEDMPTQSVSLLQSGKASIKVLPTGKISELHRDNICSAGVRVAIECLSHLPIDVVEVVVHTDLLDKGTGHIASEPVLYLRVAWQAISALNLRRTEAVALVERLGGQFNWNKKNGFSAIDLTSLDVPVDQIIED